MDVYGFCGISGSGKSYRAFYVARMYSIEYIIDDGILIHSNNIVAGSSAKLEKNAVRAVKCAVFMDEKRRKEMIDAISGIDIKSILILGTSEKMIKRIAENLNLGNVKKIIKIEDVASKEEIELAQKIRNTRGMHAVPLPTFAIKKAFSGMFVNSLNILLKGKAPSDKFECTKSVVRPTFSYFGEFHIRKNVISDIAKHACLITPDVCHVSKVNITDIDTGITADISVCLKYGVNLKKTAENIRSNVICEIERLTSIHTQAVNIFIDRLQK